MSMTSLVGVLVAAVLTMLLISASRTAEVHQGCRILVYSPVWKWLTRLLWLFPLVIAIVCVVSPPSAGEGWIPFAIIAGFSAICLPLTLEVFKRCIELSEAGIAQRSAWSKPVTIGWQEVRDIAWKVTSEIEVRGQRGRSIRISLWLSGLGTLADEFEQRLAHVPSTAKIVARLRAFRV